ncbi:MAG: acyl carrier protein [Blastocatellales bacterium]
MTATMTQSEIETQVRNVIAQVFKLSPAESAGELRMGNPPQWDSMGHMQLVIELESAFGLIFPTYAMAELTDITAIARAIEQHGKA